jgi:hypothetical protein
MLALIFLTLLVAFIFAWCCNRIAAIYAFAISFTLASILLAITIINQVAIKL